MIQNPLQNRQIMEGWQKNLCQNPQIILLSPKNAHQKISKKDKMCDCNCVWSLIIDEKSFVVSVIAVVIAFFALCIACIQLRQSSKAAQATAIAAVKADLDKAVSKITEYCPTAEERMIAFKSKDNKIIEAVENLQNTLEYYAFCRNRKVIDKDMATYISDTQFMNMYDMYVKPVLESHNDLEKETFCEATSYYNKLMSSRLSVL